MTRFQQKKSQIMIRNEMYTFPIFPGDNWAVENLWVGRTNLVRETNFVKRNIKSNLHDVLPDGTLMSTDAVFYLSAKTLILTWAMNLTVKLLDV